uniref:Reverse transcriptase domain-containing protein n=1 Tax=Amphimedon queenslandica TaxID=400682 RepID=A0A1X7SE02_AMPQE
SNCRDLGIVFSSDLSWSNHYKHISKKAYGQLLLLKRTFTTTCPSVKRLLYISLVRSQITYCSPVWRPMFIKDIVTLERIQRRSTKFIVGNSLSY